MAETDEESKDGLSGLPKRASRRLIQGFRHDLKGFRRKAGDIIPSAFILFVEKWLGFWFTLISLTLTIGSLGMGLVYTAEIGSTIPFLASTVPWLLGHIWIVGLLVVLTYGVVLISLLLVSAARIVLWSQETYLGLWNRNTPPFTTDNQGEGSIEWPPTEQQRNQAIAHTRDYLGNGAILFVSIVFALFLLEQIATETLNKLLSSPLLMVIGNSIDLGIGVLNFESVLGMAAPDANQSELVLFVLFIVLPASIMAIGTRNLLYLIEGYIRTKIEHVREGNLFSLSTGILLSIFIYSIVICTNILSQWM